jgi:hypothetical protein
MAFVVSAIDSEDKVQTMLSRLLPLTKCPLWVASGPSRL